MIKKTLFLAILLLGILKINAQEIKYNFPKLPQWGAEKFAFPLDFAPHIPFRGVEDIRFAPGWGDSKSSEYWAYTFLWFIEGKPRLSKDTINSYLRQYYDGLYISNFKNKTVTPPKNFTVADMKNIPSLLNDQETYEGRIMTLDFLTGEPITFYARIHVRNLPEIGHSAILTEISPQGFKQPVWVDMNNIVAGFSITDNSQN